MGITLEDRVTFAAALWEDAEWARRTLDGASEADKAHARRAYVRASFAALEGSIHGTKQWMLRARTQKGWKLSLGELACLREKNYEVDDGGGAKERRVRAKTVSNLKFTAKLADRLAPNFKPDFGGADWQALRTAVEIRNRIVHPKTIDQLQLNGVDAETVEKGVRYARKLLNEIHKAL